MKKFLLLTVLTALLCCVNGCSNDSNESTAESFVENPVIGRVAKRTINQGDLPEWLGTKVQQWDSSTYKSIVPYVFKGEWNGETIYFIYSPLYSCIFCEVYYADGRNVDWEESDFENFQKSTHNWYCIYTPDEVK